MKAVVIVFLVLLFLLYPSIALGSQNHLLANFEKSLGLSAREQLLAIYGGEVILPLHKHLILHEIFNRLVRVVKGGEHEYSLTVLKSNEANAFSLPGGFVFVTEGLLDLVGLDEHRIAAVLAHEIAHIEKKHGLNAVLRQMGFSVLVELGIFLLEVPPTEAVRAAVQALITVVQSGYSREAELEADILGQRYSARAGFDPVGIIHMLSDLSKTEGLEISKSIFGSHPQTSDRINLLLENAVSYWSPPIPIQENTISINSKEDPLNRFAIRSIVNEFGQNVLSVYDYQNETEVSWLADLTICDLVFSPDGLTMAAVVEEQGEYSIYIYNRFGNFTERRQHERGHAIQNLVFSPDGEKIAYNSVTKDSSSLWIGFINEITRLNIAEDFTGIIIDWNKTGLIVVDEAEQYYCISPPKTYSAVLSDPVPRIIERKPRFTLEISRSSDGNCIKLIRPHIFNF